MRLADRVAEEGEADIVAAGLNRARDGDDRGLGRLARVVRVGGASGEVDLSGVGVGEPGIERGVERVVPAAVGDDENVSVHRDLRGSAGGVRDGGPRRRADFVDDDGAGEPVRVRPAAAGDGARDDAARVRAATVSLSTAVSGVSVIQRDASLPCTSFR